MEIAPKTLKRLIELYLSVDRKSWSLKINRWEVVANKQKL